MSLGNKLNTEVKAWAMLCVVVVIISLVLLRFKTSNPGNMTCATGYTFNASANNCYLTTNSSVTTAIATPASTVDTFVTALSEPSNWVAIVIIALIGFGLLRYFQNRKKA